MTRVLPTGTPPVGIVTVRVVIPGDVLMAPFCPMSFTKVIAIDAPARKKALPNK